MLEEKVIEDNIIKFLADVDSVCRSCGRNDKIRIVAATKTQPEQVIDFLERTSYIDEVGENRVQEFTQKYREDSRLLWHVIGQLQTNKVKYVVGKATLIHSLDRLSLADEIQKQAQKRGVIQDCLVEINMGSEISKGGIEPQELLQFVESLRGYANIRVKGIMSVMPNVGIAELIVYYSRFAKLFDSLRGEKGGNIQPEIASCGMSGDYRTAIEYGGSNMVRPGRILFGERNYQGVK